MTENNFEFDILRLTFRMRIFSPISQILKQYNFLCWLLLCDSWNSSSWLTMILKTNVCESSFKKFMQLDTESSSKDVKIRKQLRFDRLMIWKFWSWEGTNRAEFVTVSGCCYRQVYIPMNRLVSHISNVNCLKHAIIKLFLLCTDKLISPHPKISRLIPKF